MDEKLKLMAIKGTYSFNGREEMCINFSAIEDFFSKKKESTKWSFCDDDHDGQFLKKEAYLPAITYMHHMQR